jgi:hypothetical protein
VPRATPRVAVLLVLLGVVALWAVGRTRERRARTAWDRPVDVAVLVLGQAPDGAVEALAGTLDAIGGTLEAERRRHDPAASGPPLRFEVAGPVVPTRLPPVDPPGDGLVARALHALELWRAVRAAHRAAPGFQADAADVRIYVVAAPGAGARFAEGLGEAGGEVGVVRAGLGGDALLAATAVVHEALHCLGATDKYDEAGHAREPEGLVEPGLTPRHPQRRAELMVGEVPLAPGVGRLPVSAAELGVGPVTAAELGWREGGGR